MNKAPDLIVGYQNVMSDRQDSFCMARDCKPDRRALNTGRYLPIYRSSVTHGVECSGCGKEIK